MPLLDLFKGFNDFDKKDYFLLNYNRNNLGYIYKDNVKLLTDNFTNDFFVTDGTVNINLSYNNNEFLALTNFFKNISKKLLELKIVKSLYNEDIDIVSFNSNISLFKIDRSLISFFGLTSHGIHLNGYVEKEDGLYIWIAKRSKNKVNYPSLLDNITAGAISAGYSKEETVIKEAKEEANIAESIAKKAVFSSTFKYLYLLPNKNIKNDVVNVFDLKLNEDFMPKVNDGEVEEFRLLKAEDVLNLLINNGSSFKFNSSLVMLDFLIRKNVIQKKDIPKEIIDFFASK